MQNPDSTCADDDDIAENVNDMRRTLADMGNINLSDNIPSDRQEAGVQGSSDEFRREQRSDKTLQAYWTRAEAGSNKFKIINGLLYRKFSNGVNATQEYALAVPEK